MTAQMLISVKLADKRYCDGCLLWDNNVAGNPMVKGTSCSIYGSLKYNDEYKSIRPDACKAAEEALRRDIDHQLLEQETCAKCGGPCCEGQLHCLKCQGEIAKEIADA